MNKLWRDYGGRGLAVLGFPCDQFGHQEPGDEAEIKNFCSLNYEVTFPLFAKIDVNGDKAHPLWKWLKDEKGGFLGIDAIKWNFSKFLVGRDGKVLKRFAPPKSRRRGEGHRGRAGLEATAQHVLPRFIARQAGEERTACHVPVDCFEPP